MDGENNSREQSVLLVEPETLVRFAIKRLIDSLDGFHVEAEAGSVSDAVKQIEKSEPELIVTEIALPGPSGLELLLELERRNMSKPQVLILSQVDSIDLVRQALLAGAKGYVLKSSSFETFVDGLKSASLNRRYFPSEMEEQLQLDDNTYELRKIRENDPLGPLSPREREIFHLLANGLQNNGIAKKLYISPRTVETHRARIVRKLELSSNGELIRFAIKHGLSVL